jgi:hypothetical protein
VFPWFSIQHNAWSFEVAESVRTVGAQRTEGSKMKKWTEWICPCNISYCMQMKEKICLTGLLLGTDHECITTNPNQSVLQCNGNVPVHLQPKSSKFIVMLSAGKVMLPMFWNSQGVCYPIFRNVVKMWILHRTAKFCWSFGMQFAENIQGNWQEVYYFIMKMPDPIQPKQPRRQFKNYSGNFLNIRLTARTWPLVTSICLAP